MNIYRLFDSRILLLIPLMLFIFAGFNIHKLDYGIEFTGGTLITGISEKQTTSEEISAELERIGHFGDVRVSETPGGVFVEIELRKTKELNEREEMKNRIIQMGREYQQLILYEKQDEAIQLDKEMRALAGSFFEQQGYVPKKPLGELAVVQLEREVAEAYQNYLTNYYSDIEELLREKFGMKAFSVTTVTSTLSKKFIEEAKNVLIISGILSVLLVVLYFRSIVPAFVVLLGALFDIIFSIGFMAYMGIHLTFASFAALLMIIGFSIDTSMLLTIRALKRKELIPEDRLYETMKTGLTMTVTTILSFSLLYIVSTYLRIPTYYEIAATAILGLIGDIFATWFLNAVMLIYYLKRIEKSVQKIPQTSAG